MDPQRHGLVSTGFLIYFYMSLCVSLVTSVSLIHASRNPEPSCFGSDIVSTIKGFSKYDFQNDLIVEVEGQAFKCNKKLLATHSLFFMDYFQSRLGTDNRIVLNYISANTFELILQMISTHKTMLVMSNVLDIWEAAHFLQIKFVLIACERLVSDHVTVETLEEIYIHAKLFNAVKVLKFVHLYVRKHFEAVCESKAFLALTFDDLIEIIKSNKVKVASEDVVMQSIFRWASRDGEETNENGFCRMKTNNNPNVNGDKLCNSNDNFQQLANRSIYISRLLRASRILLASLACLNDLLSNRLVERDIEVKNIIIEATKYQLSRNKHGYWPSSACHRSNSKMVHVGVFIDKNYVRVWDLKSNSFRLLPHCPGGEQKRTATTVFDNDLYIIVSGSEEGSKSIYALQQNIRYYWLLVNTIQGVDIFMVSIGAYIYTFDRCTGQVHFLNPKEESIYPLEIISPKLINIRHAFCYEDNILVFCSSIKDSMENTLVYFLNVATKTITRCKIISGPAKFMVSFQTESGYYVMQRNGSLWQVAHGGEKQSPIFTYIKRIWSFIDRPKGAFVYNENLYVIGNNSKYTGNDTGVEGVFKRIVYRRRSHCSSNLVHCVLKKDCLSDTMS